jgi:hypothetical protein
MAHVTWQTPAGDLGTHPEQAEFSLKLEAASAVSYTIISGSLPPGIQLYRDGRLYGIPVLTTAGKTSMMFNFSVRAHSDTGQISDRGFSITINGLIPPMLITPSGSLGTFFDSAYIHIPLEVVEVNPGAVLTWRVIAGSLPPGISITSAGVIQGFSLSPAAGGAAGTAAYGTGNYDQFVYDFEGATLSGTYNFTIQVFDGTLYDQRSYSIKIYSASYFRTDNIAITADADIANGVQTVFTADKDGAEYPTILTDPAALTTVKQNSEFAFQFQAYYPNSLVPIFWRSGATGAALFDEGANPQPDDAGNTFPAVPFDTVSFDQSDLHFPPGLTLDRNTGWLTGNVGSVTSFRSVYSFQIQAYIELVNSNAGLVTQIASEPVTYTLKILESIANPIVWHTPANLGVIQNGATSTLSISAATQHAPYPELTYSLVSGQYVRLPQGLTLANTGLIQGRTTFDYYSMDKSSVATVLDNSKTRFDTTYTFTVLAQDSSGYIYDTRTFTLTVVNVNTAPYENLYIRAFLPPLLRTQFLTTINDASVLTDVNAIVYRPGDPNFGLARDIKFLAVPGLHADTPASFIGSMINYHRNKQIDFDTLKIAYATDPHGQPLYEVIYMDVLDYNTAAMSTASENLRTLEDNSRTSLSNSFANMTQELVAGIGYEYQGALPAWMTSQQPDTNLPLGFTRAMVIGYFLPGKGQQMLFRYTASLQASGFGVHALLNQYAFEADRYQLDSSLLANYDFTKHKFTPSITTTFDVVPSTGLIYKGPWVQQTSPTNQTLRSVVYAGGQYTAVGAKGTILTSLDGTTWNLVQQSVNLGYSAGIISAVAAGSAEFQFGYGAPFSLGDEIMPAGGFASSSNSYITQIKRYIGLSRPYVPAYATALRTSTILGGYTIVNLLSVDNIHVNDYVSSANISITQGVQVQAVFPANLSIAINTVTNVISQSETLQFQTIANPVVGNITPGTSIEFTNFTGNTFMLTAVSQGISANSSLFFSDISALQQGYAVQIAGIKSQTFLANVFSANNSVLLTQNTTNLIASGTTVSFIDSTGNSYNFITAGPTPAASNVVSFTTAVTGFTANLISPNISVRLANIAPGSFVQSLSTNVVVTSACVNPLGTGAQLYFTSVISSNANAGDSVINISSTTNIGIGSQVIGSSVSSPTLQTATWPSAVSASTLILTVPTADILGPFPFVGMTVVGYRLPNNSNVVAVSNTGIYTKATISFPTTNVTGNPVLTAVANLASANSTVSSKTYLSTVQLTSLANVSLNDYITSSNISIAAHAQVVGIFSSNTSILIQGSANVISAGETIKLQAPTALTFLAQSIIQPGTQVIARTATSVTLSQPLLAPLLIGYDSTLSFQLGTPDLNNIIWDGSEYLSVGSGGSVFQSYRGVWSESVIAQFGDLNSVAYDPITGTWITVGTLGTILSTNDRINWTSRSTALSLTYYSIACQNSEFIIVGAAGTILYSVDHGVTWNTMISGTAVDLYSVRYLVNSWFITGAGGTLLIGSSPDIHGNIVWTKVSTGVTTRLYDINYSNGIYAIVGSGGLILNSSDAYDWYTVDSNSSNDLYALSYDAYTSLAVGTTGTLLLENRQFVVDWAIRNVSFEMFNYNSLAQLAQMGYPVKAGDTLIFAQQEGFNPTQHRGSAFENQGWNLYQDPGTDSFDARTFDTFTVVPGYGSPINQRGGVWKVMLNSNNVAYLSFVRQVLPHQVVQVITENGQLVYSPSIQPGATTLAYVSLNPVPNSNYKPTTFDAGGTRFSSNRDSYLSDPNTNDKYLKFKSTGVSL